MDVLGLDLSLTKTGYAYEQDGGVVVGTLKNSLRGNERLDWIAENVMTMARGRDLVAVEGYSFGSKGSAVFQIAELGGVVRLELWRAGIPYVDVPPSVAKKYATNNGNADKTAMIIAARERLGYEGQQEDEADAQWVRAVVKEALGEPIAVMPKAHVAAVEFTGSGKKKRDPLTKQVADALGVAA